jgi:hypothetical protein
MIEVSLSRGSPNNQYKEIFDTMLKMKLLVGLATLVTAMVVIVIPASAEFQSNGQSSQGKDKSYPELTTFQSTVGGPKVECKATNSEGKVVAEGEWDIQVKQANSQGIQEQTKKGPHEQLKFKKWGVCTGPVGLPVRVNCNLQVEQAGQSGNTGSVYPPGCKVEVGNEGGNICILNVGATGNKELGEVKLGNGSVQNTVEINSEVKGITSTIEEKGGECSTLLIKPGKAEGVFITKNPLVTEGQKLV